MQIFVILSNLTLDSNGHLACKELLHELHNISCSRNKLKGTSAPQSSRNHLCRKRSLSKTQRKFLFSYFCKEGLFLGLQGLGKFKHESEHNHKQGSLVCNPLCDLLSAVFFLCKSGGKPNVLAICRGSQLRSLTSLLKKWRRRSERTWRTLRSSHRYVHLSVTHGHVELQPLTAGISSAPFHILALPCCFYILHFRYSLLCTGVLLQGGSSAEIRE